MKNFFMPSAELTDDNSKAMYDIILLGVEGHAIKRGFDRGTGQIQIGNMQTHIDYLCKERKSS